MPTPVSATVDTHPLVLTPGGDRDLAAGRREPDRVVDEVEQHLVDPLAVGVDQRGRRGPRARAGRRSRRDRRRSRRSPGRRAARAAIEARAGAAPRRDSSRDRSRSWSTSRPSRSVWPSITCSVSRVRLLDAVGEVLQVRTDRGDRGLQLVRDVGDEVAPATARGCSSSALIRLNATASCPTSSRLLVCDARRVVAHLHPPRRGRHVAQRLRHPAGEPPRDQERDQPRAPTPARRNCHHTLWRNPRVAEIRPSDAA